MNLAARQHQLPQLLSKQLIHVGVINRLVFDACLVKKEDLRMTLANVPVCEALFEYSGVQFENDSERQVAFDLNVIALGEIAQVLNQSSVGNYYRLQGFLNRKSLKSVKLRLHVTHVTTI